MSVFYTKKADVLIQQNVIYSPECCYVSIKNNYNEEPDHTRTCRHNLLPTAQHTHQCPIGFAQSFNCEKKPVEESHSNYQFGLDETNLLENTEQNHTRIIAEKPKEVCLKEHRRKTKKNDTHDAGNTDGLKIVADVLKNQVMHMQTLS
jgi:predicted transcriptional regulator